MSIPWWMGVAGHLGKGFFPSTIGDYGTNILVGWDALKGLNGRPKPKL